MAFPCWIEGGDPGRQCALKNEAIELFGGVPSAAHFSHSADGNIIEVTGGWVTEAQRRRACLQGLEIAIKKKARYAGKGITLVVYAKGFRPNLNSPKEFYDIARLAIEKSKFPPFDRVCFLEYDEAGLLNFCPETFPSTILKCETDDVRAAVQF